MKIKGIKKEKKIGGTINAEECFGERESGLKIKGIKKVLVGQFVKNFLVRERERSATCR